MAEKLKMEGKSCSKVTNNPFFNFLRCYRAQAMNQHCSAVETAVKGAKIWQKLSIKQREPFQKMAEPLLKPGIVRKPRSSVPRHRRARSSRSHSRIRRTTTAGRKRSTARPRSTTRRRSATRRSATRRTTRRSATRRSATRRSATQRTTRRSTSRRRKAATAPSAKRRSRSRSATKKRATTRQRAASSTKRRKSATRGNRKAVTARSSTVARTTRKRTSRKRSRSRSRTRSAPAKRIRRSKKSRSTSRKRGRPAGTRGRPRRSKPVKLESFISPAGCDVCPQPSISTDAKMAKAPTSSTKEGSTIAPVTGSVLMSTSINKACNTSLGAAMMQQESFESKMVADDPGSPAQFHLSSDKLVVGQEMDLNLSTNKRMAEGKKPTRNRSVLSEDETASAGSQEPAKRRRR